MGPKLDELSGNLQSFGGLLVTSIRELQAEVSPDGPAAETAVFEGV